MSAWCRSGGPSTRRSRYLRPSQRHLPSLGLLSFEIGSSVEVTRYNTLPPPLFTLPRRRVILRTSPLRSSEKLTELKTSPMNQLLSGYRAFLAASIQGRTTSRFSETHRLAPASGSSSSLITDSRSLICFSVSSSASINAYATGSFSSRSLLTMVKHSAGSFVVPWASLGSSRYLMSYLWFIQCGDQARKTNFSLVAYRRPTSESMPAVGASTSCCLRP